MPHRLLVLGSLDEFIQLVCKAKQRGYYVAVCDGYENGPAKKYANASYNIDVNNVEEIAKLCRQEHIDGIIGSFSDLLFERITQIAAAANLKWYVEPSKLDYYRNKDQQKKLLSRLGVSVSKHVVLDCLFSDEKLEGFTYPLVIKPINGYGSKGIFVVNSLDEIREKFDEVADRFKNNRIIAEEYSRGHEYNMMTWLVDGELHVISIADRDKNPQAGNRVPLLNRVAYPSKSIHKVFDEAKGILERFARATGQIQGPLSMQFFYSDNRITVCEIAGRLFGYEHELVTLCCGLDIEALLLDYVYDMSALKNILDAHSPFFSRNCAGLYFVAEHDEIVQDLTVARELQKNPYVVDSIIFYDEGEQINNYSSKPYFARYYIRAKDRDELDAVTALFFSKMKVKSMKKDNIVTRLYLEK